MASDHSASAANVHSFSNAPQSGSEEGAAPSRPVFKIRRGGLSSSLYSSLGRSRPAPSQASPSSTGRPVPSTGHNVNSGRLEATSSTQATVAQTSTSAIRTASGKPTGTEGLKLGNIDAQSISSDSEDSDIVNVMSDVRQLQKPPPPPPLPAQANGNGTPSRSFNPSYSYSLASAINDQKYRSWTDESGVAQTTCGALLPVGYQKSDNPDLPWICPVRSCRKLLSGLAGLGKHFCNAHRASAFNDNMDGTLTDLGTYADPTPGDGKSSGGTAKPSIIVSKKPMTTVESPMVLPSFRDNAPYRSTVRRGGPGKMSRLAREKPIFDGDDSADTDNETTSDVSVVNRVTTRPEVRQGENYEMANPDRPYAMWPDETGNLRNMCGALIPDGYELDSTQPDRPWICPVRSCRRLYRNRTDLGNHFKLGHYAWRLNDNLDGTFTLLSKPQGPLPKDLQTSYKDNPPTVVSREPMDNEPILEPQRPGLKSAPGGGRKWIGAVTGAATGDNAEESFIGSSGTPQALQHNISVLENEVRTDMGIIMANKDRKYSDWWDDETGTLVSMAGALIPDGYTPDYTYPGRELVCPIRSCRIACKSRRGLGYHFTHAHISAELNDNQDGTFSIVGTHSKRAPLVVSKKPLDPKEPPMRAAQLPEHIKDQSELAVAQTVQEKMTKPAETFDIARQDLVGDANALLEYIRSFVDGELPEGLHNDVAYLLGLPRKRELGLSSKIPSSQVQDQKKLASVIIQVIGNEHDRPCTACRRNGNPFNSCVNATHDIGLDIRAVLGSQMRACANCIYHGIGHQCSVKSYPTHLGLFPRNSTSKSASAPAREGEEDTAAWNDEEDDLSRVRRSHRMSTANTGDNDDLFSDSEVAPEPKRLTSVSDRLQADSRPIRSHKRRADQAFGSEDPTATNQAVGNTSRGVLESQDFLEMEEWEADAGRLTTTTRGRRETLAASNPYLAANQTIEVVPGGAVNYSAMTISSGNTQHFEANGRRTRLCAVVSGKLRILIGDEPEFVVGSHGMFKISPGVACSVTNRSYVDAKLHVTSIADR